MSNSQIIIYKTESGQTKLEVRLKNETVWLTQKSMAELFQTTSQNITIHLKNIFEEGELDENPTCKDFLQVQKEGSHNVNRKSSKMNFVNYENPKDSIVYGSMTGILVQPLWGRTAAFNGPSINNQSLWN
jgi:predicted transcriptional regulator